MDIKSKEISIVDIDSLVLNPDNNNRHSIEQIELLAKGIKHNGFRVPLIVSNRSGFVISGHGRIDAAKKLGIKEIPVIFEDFKDEAEEYQFLTFDNEIARWAELDRHAVYTKLEQIPEIDIDLLGIKDFEVEVGHIPQCDEDETPDVTHDPITKRGDVWLLGKHRVMCGDSTMIDDVDKLMQGEKADMVFTDPPYGINYSDEQTGRNRITGKDSKTEKHEKIKNDSLSEVGLEQFFYDIFKSIEMFSKTDSCAYVCYADSKAFEVFSALKNSGVKYGQNLIWKKQSLNISFHKYQYIHEPILFVGKSSNVKPYGLWNGKSNETTVVEFDKVTKNIVHPTMKPVELIEYFINNSSNKEMGILDLFLGSGSTLIACEKTNRKCYGMELDEHYCDVIINRWQNYTGKQATLESTGEIYGT